MTGAEFTSWQVCASKKSVDAIIMGPQDESFFVWICEMSLVDLGGGAYEMDLVDFGGDDYEMNYMYELDRIDSKDGTKMHSFGESVWVNYDGGQKLCVTTDRKHLFESFSKDSTLAKYSLRDNITVEKF
jgi:hypothetical protein